MNRRIIGFDRAHARGLHVRLISVMSVLSRLGHIGHKGGAGGRSLAGGGTLDGDTRIADSNTQSGAVPEPGGTATRCCVTPDLVRFEIPNVGRGAV